MCEAAKEASQLGKVGLSFARVARYEILYHFLQRGKKLQTRPQTQSHFSSMKINIFEKILTHTMLF
jgi:hypothetical protein